MTLITKGMGAVIRGGKKIKGVKETDPDIRKGIAQALKDMKKKGFIGIKRKKIPHDLTPLKNTLKD